MRPDSSIVDKSHTIEAERRMRAEFGTKVVAGSNAVTPTQVRDRVRAVRTAPSRSVQQRSSEAMAGVQGRTFEDRADTDAGQDDARRAASHKGSLRAGPRVLVASHLAAAEPRAYAPGRNCAQENRRTWFPMDGAALCQGVACQRAGQRFTGEAS
jgi:hypothetical protein